MAVTEIAEEYKKVLWNHGGSSDEIFRRRWRYVVGIASPASDYLRALPHWLAEEHPDLARICVLYAGKGTFGWQVARGILESTAGPARQSVELVPINLPLENHDILRILFDIGPQVIVLAGSFQGELGIMRTRHRWPGTVREVAAVAAGIGAFSGELGQLADGVFGPSQWEPGTTFSITAGPTSDWFLDNFRGQFGQTPDYIAAGSFVTGLVATECIRQVSSLDDEKLRAAASAWIAIRFTADFVSTPEPEYKPDTACFLSAGMENTKWCCLRNLTKAECMPRAHCQHFQGYVYEAKG